jgi:hypothetical protein
VASDEVEKGLVRRVNQLEVGQGRLLGEVGKLERWKTTTDQRIRHVETTVNELRHDEEERADRISQIDGSLRPNRGRLSIKGYPPYVVVTVFVVAILASTIVLVVWLTHRN